MRAHIRDPSKHVSSGPQNFKKASFCRTEALEWRFGVHRATVREPPKIAQNGHWMWSVNRLPCGPRTGFQIGHLLFFASHILLETTIFIVLLYKYPFKMLKFWTQFWSKFQTLKNQFEQRGRAVLWSPNRRSKRDPEIKQKITRNIKNMSTI